MVEANDSAKASGGEPRRRRSWTSRIGRRLFRSPRWLELGAGLAASYLRFVNATSSLAYEPATPRQVADRAAPLILAMWHGQNFMMPFIRPPDVAIDILVSRAGDGELIARTLLKLGLGAVRGSGARDTARTRQKGGIAAFLAMRNRLREGVSVALTAGFDATAPRRAGLGVVQLARASGRPIVPAAFATSRRIELNNWDRTTINLPFSRAVCVFGEPIDVPATADDAVLEEKRARLEESLNTATARAHALADRRDG